MGSSVEDGQVADRNSKQTTHPGPGPRILGRPAKVPSAFPCGTANRITARDKGRNCKTACHGGPNPLDHGVLGNFSNSLRHAGPFGQCRGRKEGPERPGPVRNLPGFFRKDRGSISGRHFSRSTAGGLNDLPTPQDFRLAVSWNGSPAPHVSVGPVVFSRQASLATMAPKIAGGVWLRGLEAFPNPCDCQKGDMCCAGEG